MRQSEKTNPQLDHLRDRLAETLREFTEIYSAADVVDLAGKIHTSALTDKHVSRTDQVTRAGFITHCSKLMILAMELQRSTENK